MSSPPPAPKKRQYAAGETQVYYGSLANQGQYIPDSDSLDLRHLAEVAEETLVPPPQRAQFVDIMTYPPDPRDLYAPPPEIRLPSGSGSSILSDPTASLYQSPTLRLVPKTETLLHESTLPLGLVISPHRTLEAGEDAVPLVEDGLITRCRNCRGYINPYVAFVDGGSRWRCPLCGLHNDVPQMFEWGRTPENPEGGYARAELTHPVVDFAATAEYMRAAPQAPAYVFLLDVSQSAIHSGMFHTAIRTIAENLDNIPNDDDPLRTQTKVGIICYDDAALYFFAFALPPQPQGEPFQMLVMSDLEEVYPPRPPADLLVNLSESRQSLDALLLRLPDIFANSDLGLDARRATGSAAGPALEGGLALLAPTGGKIILLSASVPTIGKGALALEAGSRQDTLKEPDAEKPASAFYHAFALSCIKACVSVDMFLAGAGAGGGRYQGVATLSLVPHYTSGTVFYYPGFNAAVREDAVKLAAELGRLLAMRGLLEAEMRVRCSRGITVKAMHGNFFVQASSRVVMPAVPQDQSYAVELQIEETLMEKVVLFQTAMLHTTSSGERRIRVLNLALPTTALISEVFASADALAITSLLAKQTVQRTSVLTLEERQEKLIRKVADICTAYMATNKTHSAHLQLLLPANLKMLPILVLGLFKKIAHLDTERTHDVRAYVRVVLASAATGQLIRYIYPDIYSLHNMPDHVGFVGVEGTLGMPTPLPLTSTWWESHGLYLVDDGQIMYLVVGRDAVPLLINDVFGAADYAALQGGKVRIIRPVSVSVPTRAIICLAFNLARPTRGRHGNLSPNQVHHRQDPRTQKRAS
ncbi:hypothetical protein K438DRAFT_1828208 [Mycena galopus ATCC 62051]|nr:hypothetical protein K438DRAFT_1828208 [Mycena galopus ATCC 62051]